MQCAFFLSLSSYQSVEKLIAQPQNLKSPLTLGCPLGPWILETVLWQQSECNATACLLPTACCLLAFCLLPLACCLLPTACLPAAICLLACCLLPCVLPSVYYLLLIITCTTHSDTHSNQIVANMSNLTGC